MYQVSNVMLDLKAVSKTFVVHLRDGAQLPVVCDTTFHVAAGECVVLGGPSGTGKSSLLKMVYGNYRTDSGCVRVRSRRGWVDVATALPRQILALRQTDIGYVSQFLRTIPRVSALEVVTAAGALTESDRRSARDKAQELLARLNVSKRLWDLPPSTFSGGEQQRINIARGFAADRPILLLDEPTASLDAENRRVVIELIEERKRAGVAILGIFHDADVRDRVANRIVDVTNFSAKA